MLKLHYLYFQIAMKSGAEEKVWKYFCGCECKYLGCLCLNIRAGSRDPAPSHDNYIKWCTIRYHEKGF